MSEVTMCVSLLAHTNVSGDFCDNLEYGIEGMKDVEPGQAIALSAIRTCYSANKPSQIVNIEGDKYFGNKASDGEGGTDADRLIRHIMRSGHTSTLEHITYTFAVEGVSRALLAQLTRHRVGFSFSVQSQRYNRYFKDEIKEFKSRIDTYKNEQKRNGYCKLSIGEELRLVDMYLNRQSTREISKMTGIPHTTVTGILNAHSVDMRNKNESVVDHDYFAEIDTHRKAQILGFICADGSVGNYKKSKNGVEYISHQLGIEVNSIDGYYLQGILDELKSRNSLSTSKRGTNSINIVSKKMIEDLERLGVVQNKTLTLDLSKIIKRVPDQFLNSFILGYFEGDGYIHKPESGSSLIITTGSKVAAEQINSILLERAGLEKTSLKSDGNISRISVYSGSQIERALVWMYKDIDLSFVLQRKLIIASLSYVAVDSIRKNKLMFISKENHFVMPERILNNPEATFTMIDYFRTVKAAYKNMVANGIPQEDARALTGQGAATNLVLTANLRALLDFYSKRRKGNGAQGEIAQLAEELKAAVINVEPWTEPFFV